MTRTRTRTRPGKGLQRGALLIEVLVAALLSAFALLAFAALQSRASSAEFEALQRSQALVLMEDMVARLNANRARADEYLVDGPVGAGAVEDCGGKTGAALDLCQWSNLIRGSNETRGTARVGSMLNARGCVSRAAGSSHRFVVAVAWQGIVSTGGVANPCGQGSDPFTDESLRRAVASTVCVALLRDPAVGAPTPRC